MKNAVFRNIIVLLFCFCFLFLFVALYQGTLSLTVSNDVPNEKTEKKNELSLIMVGDALIHEAVYADANEGGTYNFYKMISEIKPIVNKYDLAFYNQETILGGKDMGLSTYPRFNSPYEVGDAFIDAGFNLVSLANNHTLDKGEKAIINSSNYWKNKDVYTAGSYSSNEDRNKIVIKEKNGIKYAMFAYTTWTNGLRIPDGKTYLLNRYDEETVKKDIESVRDRVDLLMVSMHFGNEYSFTPSSEQKKIAKYLSSLGVNIVIGHHPHVVQPIEFIDDTLVVYSLGNVLSAQRGMEKLTGLMVSTRIVKEDDKISIKDTSAELIYTYTNYGKGYRSNFKVYPYSLLTEEILPDYKSYYNKYINIVIGDRTDIKKGMMLDANTK